jgi:hemolysin III
MIGEPKPLLRGWSHALAAPGVAAAGIALCVRSSGDPPLLVALLVYSLSLCELFAVSAVYHIGAWRPAWRQRLRALDHASIFVLIAGTYTPIAFSVLSGWERLTVLVGIWLQAVMGTALSVRLLRLPRGANVALYVGMGWLAMISAPSLLSALSLVAIGAFVLGGLAYTAGALVYALRWPDPFPRVFGFHELFHILVIGGSVAFAAAIWIWVVPFPRN